MAALQWHRWLFTLVVLLGASSKALATGGGSTVPSSAAAAAATPAALIVVSYDAFRTEYLRRNSTSFMNELRRNGTTAEYLRNVFPTKTFPNHHSIATGVYPNQHGVMANEIYDHIRGKFEYSYEMYHFSDDIVPIWVSMGGGVVVAYQLISCYEGRERCMCNP